MTVKELKEILENVDDDKIVEIAYEGTGGRVSEAYVYGEAFVISE